MEPVIDNHNQVGTYRPFSRVTVYLVFFVLLLSSFLVIGLVVYEYTSDDYYPPSTLGTTDGTTKDGACTVAYIKVQGEIVSYIPFARRDSSDGMPLHDEVSSEEVVRAIEQADTDSNIKAIIIEIDSTGGNPTASEEIALAVKRTNKPTVAVIRTYANSGAYMIASAADRIFASKFSDIGSIGVISSYTNEVEKNKKEGIAEVTLTSAKYKDIGSSTRVMTQEEKNLLLRDILISHQLFVQMVAENRHLDIEKVKGLADGSSMLGETALEKGLVDEIGGMVEAKEYLSNVTQKDVSICE